MMQGRPRELRSNGTNSGPAKAVSPQMSFDWLSRNWIVYVRAREIVSRT